MKDPGKRSRLRVVEDTAPRMGAIPLSGHTPDWVAKEILRRARAAIVPTQLWLVDRGAMRLRRPAFSGLQREARVQLAPDEPLSSWPDVLRIPGPAPTPALAGLAKRIAGSALARGLRAPDADPAAIHGYLVAPYPGRRPPVALDRTLAVMAAEAATLLSNAEALWQAEERALQLSTLYDAAHELSAQLDVDRVLAAICARARTLTGAELAYLMLLDPARGDGYVRATDGVRTDEFKSVRLGLGWGLGGLVAKEGRPYYSSDYLHDGRFVHVVDEIVANEGVVSVMGVPLIVERTVEGVLFAAYRRMTTFSDEDVAVLESLAEHAAIALANARLHDQTSKALEREKRLHRIAENQRNALEQVTALHARLTELVLAEPTIQDLLRDIGDALGHPVELLDAVPEDGTGVPIAAGATVLGWLSVPNDGGPPSAQEVQALEQAARVVAVHMLRDRAVVQAQYRLRGEFLDELLTVEERSRRELVIRGSYLGTDLSDTVAVLFLVAEDELDQDRRDRLTRTMQELAPNCLIAARFGGGVVLAPRVEPRAFAQRIAERLARAIDCRFTIGFAAEQTAIEGIGEALAEARHAVRGARALGKTGEVVSRDDLGVYGILLLDEGGELVAFAERLLAPLLDYDRRQSTNLLETLDVYLDAGGNVTEAARRLVLHVNSLYYRLKRIRELGIYDLDDPERRFELQLAIRALRASRSSP